MLTYFLEKDEHTPLYESLYRNIHAEILNGKLSSGEKLPSKRLLAKHLKISITTVENAYNQLLAEGFIYSIKGSGFYVSKIEHLPETHSSSLPVTSTFSKAVSQDPEYIIDFKVNHSSLKLFPFSVWGKILRGVITNQDLHLLETVPYNGLSVLRVAIANHLYRFRKMEVNPEQIIIGAGTEYLYGRLLQLFPTNTNFAIEDPGYKKFSDISRSMHIGWDYIPIDSEGINMEYLKKSRADVVHVSPANHFPTGTVMSINRRFELLKWASLKAERYIIEDDYDSELRYTAKVIPPLYTIDKSSKVIYMNTFSKTIVPSLRISYMVLPLPLLRHYEDTLSFYSCTVSSFEQLALTHFINEGYFDRHINRLKKHYLEKRNHIISAIQNSDLSKITQIQESDAGTHFLLKVNTHMNDGQIHQAASHHSINFALLSDYEHVHNPHNSRTLVINYAGIESEQIELAIQLLEKLFAKDLPPKK